MKGKRGGDTVTFTTVLRLICKVMIRKKYLPMSWVAWVDFSFVNEKNSVGLVKVGLH